MHGSKICAAAAVLHLVAVTVGCRSAAEVHSKVPTAVRVQAVSSSAPPGATRYSASIHPATTVEVSFRVGGYIEDIARMKGVDGRMRLVQEGDRVTRNAQLASVRRADYAQRRDEAKAALAEALAAKEQAQIDFDRASRLASNQSIAAAELDGARARLNASVARVAGSNARLQESETALADTTLRAPLNGLILRRNIELGALVPPGAAAFTIADVDTVKAVFGVPDTVVETLRLGTVQTVGAEGTRRELEGRITRISPSADPKSRVFEVEVSLPNDGQALKAGMVVVLKLGTPAVAAAPITVLPLSAVVRSPTRAGQFAVFVVTDHEGHPTARVREVELGEFLGNLIPIKAGVQPGEAVVVSGATLLADGETVQVIPADHT